MMLLIVSEQYRTIQLIVILQFSLGQTLDTCRGIRGCFVNRFLAWSHDDGNDDDYDNANDDATGNASLWFRSIRINW